MRRPTLLLCTALPLLLSALALTQDAPAVEPVLAAPRPTLDATSAAGSQPASAAALQLSPEVVQKLSAEQIVNVLKAHEVHQLLRQPNEAELDAGMAVEIVVPLAFFGCVALVVGLVLLARLRRHAQVQETLRLMVEKGRDIPPELLVPVQPPRADLRRGILLIAIGVGVSGFLLLVDGADGGAWGLGMIPLLIGVGYLIVWRLAGDGSASTPSR